ncbi:MAG TPA: DUF3574 domain-containing protein [Caulobacteraceae bacterium]|jgi:hypothetical protein|nr:DUF3574 domain-containing protein [Caulobacteraceae bacterium]
MSAHKLAVVPALALALFAGPALAKQWPACPAGLHTAATAELFFGRDVGAELGVSQEDWQDFLDREVTPRFPDGLSVFDVYGQYRNPRGVFVREPSKALLLILTGAEHEREKVKEIRDAYKARFRQDSVMLIERAACVSF